MTTLLLFFGVWLALAIPFALLLGKVLKAASEDRPLYVSHGDWGKVSHPAHQPNFRRK